MFLAMNRFRIARGREAEFVEHWRQRESYLHEVPGFREFHLLQLEPMTDEPAEFTLFASHTMWDSEAAFEAWTRSEAFRKAHANAGATPRDLYLGPPQLELFNSVL
ncbi:MAG TPA: antibiotic biosynthesis monooxygenase [Azospira sp.]|nr:antibiotic biosynthesis monooxygenase [Azospira sp.]